MKQVLLLALAAAFCVAVVAMLSNLAAQQWTAVFVWGCLAVLDALGCVLVDCLWIPENHDGYKRINRQ